MRRLIALVLALFDVRCSLESFLELPRLICRDIHDLLTGVHDQALRFSFTIRLLRCIRVVGMAPA